MRFCVRQPKEPTDLRDFKFETIADLDTMTPVVASYATELEAKYHVRRLWTGAVVMPFPVTIGSGQTVLLGVLVDASRPVSAGSRIPFDMFVQPVSESDADRDRIRHYLAGKRELWNRELWRVKPIRPDMYKNVAVEVRATELEVPFFTQAKIGHVEGRLVMFLELGDHEISVHFDDPAVTFERQRDAVASPGVRDSTVQSLRAVPADDDRDEAG